MANLPEDEFDWDAYHRDTRVLSPAARGAWWDCLFKMRLSVTRGRISMPIEGYARMFGSSVDHAVQMIDEITTLEIGDAEFQDNNGNVTQMSQTSEAPLQRFRNGNITLINRRMYRQWIKAKSNAERQLRFRDKIARGDSNAKVTKSKKNALLLEEEAFKEKKEKKKKKSVESTRITESFPLTEEMQEWAKSNVPELDLISAHLNFVEYWANNTTAKAFKVNWRLTWEKGMKLALRWQKERNQNGNQNGNNRKTKHLPTLAEKEAEIAERRKAFNAKAKSPPGS